MTEPPAETVPDIRTVRGPLIRDLADQLDQTAHTVPAAAARELAAGGEELRRLQHAIRQGID